MPGSEINSALLVRHPPPFPTESLFGYILRLSQENGYTTPWHLFSVAEMKQSETRTAGIKVAKLAAVAYGRLAGLEAIAYRGSRQSICRLLGHPLIPIDLRLTKPQLCARCITDKGFVEAHWDLALMTGCPIHGRSLLSSCPACGHPLRWFRRGLLECHCGADLLDRDLPPISIAEVTLLDIIRRKVLRLGSPAENNSSLPVSDLQGIDLRSLLFLIKTLGKYRMIVDNSEQHDPKGLVRAAAHILENWPTNFFGLLKNIGAQPLSHDTAGSVRQQFDGIYSCLFKYGGIADPKQADFLRLAFLDFAANHWGRGFVDKRLMKPLGRELPAGRFQTPSDVARQLGVDPRTASRLLENKKILRKKVRSGAVEKSLIDSDLIDIHRTSPGRIYRLRQAAALLGLSPSVLRELRISGDFQVKHLQWPKHGFHSLDIEEFSRRIFDLRSSPNPTHSESIALTRATGRFYEYLGGGAAIVRAVLSRELSVSASIDGTVGGLLIPHTEFQCFVSSARSHILGKTRSFDGAAADIACDSGCIQGLIELGLLKDVKTPAGVRVTEESINHFNGNYKTLGVIARDFSTTSRSLMDFCQRNAVPVILVRKRWRIGQHQAIIRRENINLLRRRYSHLMRKSIPKFAPYAGSASHVMGFAIS